MFGWVYWLIQYTPNRWPHPIPPHSYVWFIVLPNTGLLRYAPNPRNSLFCNPCLLLRLHPFYISRPDLPSQLEIHLQPLPPNIKQQLRVKSPPPDSTVSGLRPHCFVLHLYRLFHGWGVSGIIIY
ncbi:uncharacterized protein [Gossypium hirsutum]|uniref:Uncharacterized protein n=1 Tax=Gossypium hirsutum TaxID=3635 RepID=A0ABM2YI35_GOSHI|nr:uncharacterized protein LOC107899621 [Gossypium hirsutum]